MKKALKLFILLIFCGSLVACVSNKNEESNANLNDQNKSTEEQSDENQNNDSKDNKDVDANNNNETNQNQNVEENDSETENENNDESKIVIENDAFKVFEPAPNLKVSEDIIVSGLARVFEGTVNYEFEDGHFIMDEGFATASEGAPGWGEFEFTVNIDGAIDGSASVILFEVSAKDGSRIHELIIPVTINN